MGIIKYQKKIVLYGTILLMSFGSLISANASLTGHEVMIGPEDKDRYVVVDDPFDRSLFGGIIQRTKIRVNQWFNGTGTIYENTTLNSITINGYTLSISDIKKNPDKLKELISSRDEEVGITDIEVTNDTYDQYEYKEYLDLLIQNAQPMQIVSDTTWTNEEGPYYIAGEIHVMKGATLTIEAGTEVYFRNTPSTQYRSGILVDGNLVLEGTKSEKIKLAPYGDESTSGSWKGIYVTERGTLTAKHTLIEKAGGWTDSAIYSYGPINLNAVEIRETKGSAITAFDDAIIENSIFKDNDNYGIDLYRYNQSYKTIVRNNQLESNKTAGRIIIRQTTVSEYDVSNNTSTSTELNGFILGGDIIGDMTFTNLGENLPYILMNTPGVNGEMKPFTIYPRSEVDFTDTIIKVVATPKPVPNHGIVVNGTMNLTNSTITSLRDNTIASTTDITDNIAPSNRDWRGLVVSESGTLNVNQSTIKHAKESIYTHGTVNLSEAIIEDAFSGIQGDGTIIINNSNFTNLEAPAFRYYAGNEPLDISVRNSTFTNINDVLGKVQVHKSGGELELVNLTANQVKKNGIELTGNFSLDTTISQPGINLPYIIPQLVINESTAIDVTGKTILKVEDGLLLGQKAGIDVYGQLNLNGTSSDRVTVTSLRDDSIGGDSNGDGPSTKPAAGDWGSINYHSKTKNRNSLITYSDIKYGGDNHKGYALGGEGKFNIQDSTVVDSSEAGIGVLGTITIENSKLERNHGYGVHVRSNTNFSVTMNNNQFKDNLDYAAFVEFGSTLDHIEVSGNTAQNNMVNGIGITGTVRYNLGLLPAGPNFPYVIPNTLVVNQGSSLTLNPKTVVKFQPQGQLDVEGHLIAQGTNIDKVYFTSILDDSLAGDTNNDGSSTEGNERDWKGIIYHAESEGTFKNFECKYSILNMDYSKIPYLRAVAKGDDSVSISGTKVAYIKSIDNKDKVYTYDFSTGIENLISSNDNKKSNIMLDGNTIAWVENSNEVIVRLSDGRVQKYSGNYVYLGDNHIVVRDDYTNYYGKIGNDNLKSIDNIHPDFEPVISSQYLFYKDTKNQLYKLDLNSKKAYYVISENNYHKEVSLYKDSVAMVSSQSISGKPQIYVSNIDNWNTMQTTLDTDNYIKYVSLLGDKLLYYRNGKKSELVIQSSTNSNSVENVSVITKNYPVSSADIGSNSLSFSDDELIYLVETFISSNDTCFIKTNNTHPGYDMNTYQGSGDGWSFGLSVDDIPIGGSPVIGKAGITLGGSKHEGVKYILNKDNNDEYRGVGLERESSNELTLGSDLGAYVGLAKIFKVGGSVGATSTSTTLRSDRYTFLYDAQSYRNLGLLNAQLMTENKSAIEDSDLYDIITRKLSMLNIDEHNVLEVKQETGKGFNADLRGQVGISGELSAGPLGLSGNLGLEANASNSNMVKIGVYKDKDGYHKYASYYSSLSGDFKAGLLDVFLGAEIDLTPDFCIDITFTGDNPNECDDSKSIIELNGISSSWPDSFLYNISNSVTVLSPTVREDGTLLIPMTTTFSNSGGYTITTIYKIKNALGQDFSLFSGLEELKTAIEVLDSDDPRDLTFNAKGLLSGYINDLFKFIHSDGEVEFETYVHKYTDEYNLGFSFNSKEVIEKEKMRGISATGGISINTSAIDEFYVLVSEGNTTNASKNMKYTAYIPVENDDVKRNMALIATATASFINPISLKYTGGQLALNDGMTNIRIEAPSFTNLHKSTFITAPLSLEGNEMELPVEGQYLVNNSVYFNTFDNHNQLVKVYPEGSEIKFYIGDTWKKELENNYAIFKYDNSSKSWIKLGGKINSSEKTISIELNEPGQYAVGYDENQPKVIFKYSNRELSSGATVTLRDYIDIEIIDDLPLSEVTVKLIGNGETVTETKGSATFSHFINGEVGKTYRLEVSYKDRFGNEFLDSIQYKIAEPTVIVSEENEELIEAINEDVIEDEIANIESSDELVEDVVESE